MSKETVTAGVVKTGKDVVISDEALSPMVPKFEVNKVDSTAMITVDENTYTDLAKSVGITKKQLHDVEKFNDSYMTAMTMATAGEAQRIMAADSKIEKVILDAPMTTSKRGELKVAIDKSASFRNIATGEDIVKSSIKVSTKIPSLKLSGTRRKELEAGLTQALLK